MTLPHTPSRSGQELIQIIDNINEKYSLDIPNPRNYSPGGDNKTPAWRCYNGLKILYFLTVQAPLNRVLDSLEDWVLGQSEIPADKHISYQAAGHRSSVTRGSGLGGQRMPLGANERKERLHYLLRLIDDEVWFLKKGSFQTNKLVESISDEPKDPTLKSLKRSISGDEDEFHTAPNSPAKDPAGQGSPMDTDHHQLDVGNSDQGLLYRRPAAAAVPSNIFQRARRSESQEKPSRFLEKLTAPDKYRRYDAAVPAAPSAASTSFAPTMASCSDLFTSHKRPYDTSFISTTTDATEPMLEVESTYEGSSVVGHMLSEEMRTTFDQQSLNLDSVQEPSRSEEGRILAELRQHGPFSYETDGQTLSRSIPLRYRYALERIGRSWNVPLKLMFAGDNITFKTLDEYWQWVTGHKQRDGKPLPEKPTRKAWEAAVGNFKTDKHSEVVVLSGDMEWCTGSERGILKLKLHPLKTERTCRFHRRFGSDRFLSLTIPAPTRPPPHLRMTSQPALLRETIARWLTQEVHRCLGRDWRPFFVEEVKSKRKSRSEPKFRVDFFAVGGKDIKNSNRMPSYISPPNQDSTNHTSMSLEALINWHMPPDANLDQSNCKLFQRFSLGLSKTYATVVLRPSQVLSLPDLPGRPVMNDGCALMSRAMASRICDMLGITGMTPSAFQGRFAGAKGLWMVDRHQSQLSAECDDEMWIQISDSQLKIHPHPQAWREPVDDEQLTFEVVTWSKPLHSVDLNIQLLAILEHGGHVREHIGDLTRQGIQAMYQDFVEVLQSDSPVLCRNLIQKLRPSADNSSGLMSQRVKRLEEWTANDAEFIIRLSEAGFGPQSFYPLRKRIGKCLRTVLNRYVDELHIEVPLSTYAFCIADPYGILKEDEVHLGFSTNWRDGQGQFDDIMLEGFEILVGRLPAHLPSDIQRRKAVWKKELRHFKDVIVFPSVGKVALAHMLSGGDYDGDTPWICWDQNIVRNFFNSDLQDVEYPPDHFGLTEYSVPMRGIKTMDEFLESAFKFNLTLSSLGRCTVEHEKIAYDESINSRSAIELASLLSHLVDGRKGGVHLSEQAWRQYRKKISPRFRDLPAYKDPQRRHKKANIIDFLRFEVARKERDKVLTQLETSFPEHKSSGHHDEDLLRVYKEVERQIAHDPEMGAALQTVAQQIKDLRTQYNEFAHQSTESFSVYALQAAEQAQVIKPPLGTHPLTQVWKYCPDEWLRYLASSTYQRYPKSSFVIHAFGEVLCQMKSSNMSARTVTHEILACYRVNPKVIAQLTFRDTVEEERDSGVDEDEYEGHEAIEAMHLGLPSPAAGGYYDPDDGMSVE
ncbi:RNA dependent RNA polymerase [Aspergillus saccharolyticus JOP 1030-1]|uniref:RNA-dependent RNA polymerase n=1 Tax=Aspergillus saccharolyticus JOP 1030-1 TaxID=1450539 RepID=A0A319AB34_9EURO|nr:putative RNA-directed RNA polymerase [Aspergillus saccharolyticus JOP 1030-1]PYH48858.1 putative RNA-directed RNA polymerase [Aspergillus saccharolyticus JOP 1030-1]